MSHPPSATLSSMIKLLFMVVSATGYTIHCWRGNCRNKFINCLPSEDCFIFCTQSGSCLNSIINCPTSGHCNIKCFGHSSCENAFVDATLSLGNLNILCDDNDIRHSPSYDHCASLHVYGSILQEGGATNVQCNGNNRSCIDLQLHCPNEANCAISCNGDTSCKNALVTGSNHGDVAVHCNGNSACLSATFEAQSSSLLNITGCTEQKSCVDLTIYCPPNTNGHKHCFVEGNDNLGRNIETVEPTSNPTTTTPTQMPSTEPTTSYNYGAGITIYAINGFDDINVDYSGSFGASHSGRMFCGFLYNKSCTLAPDNWACEMNKECNGVGYISSTTTIVNFIGHFDKPDLDSILPQNTKDGDVDYVFRYTVKENPEIFIFVCAILLIVVFMIVGFAQTKKDCQNVENEGTPQKQKSESVQVVERCHVSRHAVAIPVYPISY